MTDRLVGRVALVTGAARGQGRSHATALAREGADLVLLDICADLTTAGYPMGTPAELDETAELVTALGRRAVAVQADVRDRVAVQQATNDGSETLGRLDVVVANAGICPLGVDRPLVAFTDAVEVDLVGVLNTVHAALPHLGVGASVIVVGSVAALVAAPTAAGPHGPGGAGYALAKRLLVPYVDALATQLGPHGVRVNAVHPTHVDTPMLDNPRIAQAFRPDLVEPTRGSGRRRERWPGHTCSTSRGWRPSTCRPRWSTWPPPSHGT